jgi:hypothetical protein
MKVKKMILKHHPKNILVPIKDHYERLKENASPNEQINRT